MKTWHFSVERQDRDNFIETVIGVGDFLHEFYVDKGHANGAERHVVTTTGIVYIYNAITDLLITSLIARPGQIRRYYYNECMVAPEWLIEIAAEHQRLGYNNI